MPIGKQQLRRRQSPSETMLGVEEAATVVKARVGIDRRTYERTQCQLPGIRSFLFVLSK